MIPKENLITQTLCSFDLLYWLEHENNSPTPLHPAIETNEPTGRFVSHSVNTISDPSHFTIPRKRKRNSIESSTTSSGSDTQNDSKYIFDSLVKVIARLFVREGSDYKCWDANDLLSLVFVVKIEFFVADVKRKMTQRTLIDLLQTLFLL